MAGETDWAQLIKRHDPLRSAPRLRALVCAVALGALGAGFVALAPAPSQAQTRLPPEGFADLVEQLTPAVVNIATTQTVDGFGAPRFPRGSALRPSGS